MAMFTTMSFSSAHLVDYRGSTVLNFIHSFLYCACYSFELRFRVNVREAIRLSKRYGKIAESYHRYYAEFTYRITSTNESH